MTWSSLLGYSRTTFIRAVRANCPARCGDRESGGFTRGDRRQKLAVFYALGKEPVGLNFAYALRSKSRVCKARGGGIVILCNDEQRRRRGFLAATRRASLVLGAWRRCQTLVVNHTTARLAPCPAPKTRLAHT